MPRQERMQVLKQVGLDQLGALLTWVGITVRARVQARARVHVGVKAVAMGMVRARAMIGAKARI